MPCKNLLGEMAICKFFLTFAAKKLLMMHKIFSFLCFLMLCGITVTAQDFASPDLSGDLAYRLSASDTRLDSAAAGSLSFALDNISFFKDNEYAGEQVKGYSLPGLWVQPKLVWQPLPNVALEAGLHALIFDGANKYPCYVYHDIGRWKGNQYQRGAHVLPFFRAQAQVKNMTFVLGDIYGGANHRVMEPLMNPEINLTQDPEMGFQLLLESPRYQLDAWINWQSYIFDEDTHQEAFTVGIHQRIRLNGSAGPLQWYMPIDILVQHRGGEQDITDMGVQTITNGGVGVGMQWNTASRVFEYLNAEVAALGCWQQSGDLWPFQSGVAASATVAAGLRKGVRVFAGILYGQDFVSLYGIPFYSTLSQKFPGARFQKVLTPHVGAEWSHTFAKDYILGVKVDDYPMVEGQLTMADGAVRPSTFVNHFSFGVYFRCHPRFLLKQWQKK